MGRPAVALGLIAHDHHAKRLIGLYDRRASPANDQLNIHRTLCAQPNGGPHPRRAHHRPPGEPLPRWTRNRIRARYICVVVGGSGRGWAASAAKTG